MKRNFIYAPISSDCFFVTSQQVIKIEFLVTIYLDYWDFVPGLLLIRATYYHHWSWIKVPTYLTFQIFFFSSWTQQFWHQVNTLMSKNWSYFQTTVYNFFSLKTFFRISEPIIHNALPNIQVVNFINFREFINFRNQNGKGGCLCLFNSFNDNRQYFRFDICQFCQFTYCSNSLNSFQFYSPPYLSPFVSISSFLLHSLNHIMSTLLSFTFCVLSSTTNLPLGKLCSAFF